MSKAQAPKTQPLPPGKSLASGFGSPPLLKGEDVAAYQELADKISEAINPVDAIEELWARDIVDLFWDSLRLRRLRVKLIEGTKSEGLERLYYRLTGTRPSEKLLSGWLNGDKKAVHDVATMLKRAGLDEEAITAQVIRDEIQAIEKIDRLILQRDACRNATLRELDRRRDARARRLREIAYDIDQTKPVVLAPPAMRAAE